MNKWKTQLRVPRICLGFISFVLLKDRQMPLVWESPCERQAVLRLQPGCDVLITKADVSKLHIHFKFRCYNKRID